jgi:hypothetical protein
MARYLRLRVRAGTALSLAGTTGAGRSFHPGDEFVVRFEDATLLLRGKARRGVVIVDDFEDESDGTRPKVELRR